jgi:hypothetical protein
MASNKRTASQTEVSGPIVKRRKTSGRNTYVAFLHFFDGILKSYRNMKKKKTFSFLALPAELRNRVYEYAIGGNEIMPTCSKKTNYKIKLFSRPSNTNE